MGRILLLPSIAVPQWKVNAEILSDKRGQIVTINCRKNPAMPRKNNKNGDE